MQRLKDGVHTLDCPPNKVASAKGLKVRSRHLYGEGSEPLTCYTSCIFIMHCPPSVVCCVDPDSTVRLNLHVVCIQDALLFCSLPHVACFFYAVLNCFLKLCLTCTSANLLKWTHLSIPGKRLYLHTHSPLSSINFIANS